MDFYLNSTLVIIVIGSFIGSMKSNFYKPTNSCNRLINGFISIFVGIAVAEHFSADLTIWLAGLISLTSSMLSVTILDTIHELVPSLVKLLIKLKFGVKNDL